MLTGTKKEEDQSFDNINNLLIISTSVLILSCIMEVLMYFLYNNKVKYMINTESMTLSMTYFEVSSQTRDRGSTSGGLQEEKCQR